MGGLERSHSWRTVTTAHEKYTISVINVYVPVLYFTLHFFSFPGLDLKCVLNEKEKLNQSPVKL